jgi:hypothetical protein
MFKRHLKYDLPEESQRNTKVCNEREKGIRNRRERKSKAVKWRRKVSGRKNLLG